MNAVRGDEEDEQQELQRREGDVGGLQEGGGRPRGEDRLPEVGDEGSHACGFAYVALIDANRADWQVLDGLKREIRG